MGKKSKFIDRNKAITFKLINRDADDPNYDVQRDHRVFQVVSMPKDDHLSEKEINFKKTLLTEFSEKDQGIYDFEKVQRQKIVKEAESLLASESLKGQDLWIHELIKRKAAKIQMEDYDELEIEEEEMDEDDLEELDEGQEDDDEYSDIGELPNEEEYREMIKNEEAEQKREKLKEQIFREEQAPDYKKMVFNENIQMKKFNEFGLPETGYDYSQHVAKAEGGEVVAVFNVKSKKPLVQLKPDLDYQPEEMTKDQKEVFEALQAEEEGVYEELEDDFVSMVNQGEDCILDIELDKKKVTKLFREKQNLEEKVEKKDEEILSRGKVLEQQKKEDKQLEDQKVQKKKVEQVEKKKVIQQSSEDESINEGENEGEDEWESEEEELDEEEELKKVMGEFEEAEKAGQGERKYLNKDEFESILDEHLKNLLGVKKVGTKNDKKQEKLKVQFKDQNQENQENQKNQKNQENQENLENKEKSDSDSDENSESEEDKLQQKRPRGKRWDRRIKDFESKDDKEKKMKAIYGDELFTRTHYKPLKMEEDNALQLYLQESADDEEKDKVFEMELLKQRFTKTKQDEVEEENIVTKSFNTTNVQGALNVVQDNQGKRKDSKNISVIKEIEKSRIEMRPEEEVFVKRNKGESAEEKKARKQQIKEFKKLRKEKNQEFKQNFEELTKNQTKRLAGSNGTSLKGVSVQKY